MAEQSEMSEYAVESSEMSDVTDEGGDGGDSDARYANYPPSSGNTPPATPPSTEKPPPPPPSNSSKSTTTEKTTPSKTASTKTGSTKTRKTTTTTTTPPPLMCSVSETATHQTMYPGDGICDILMYTDVRLLNQAFEEPIVPASYQLFLELSAKTYKKTTCGISLDVRDDVTVVVIITCVLTVRSLSTCKAMPASAWDPKNNMMSSMKNTIPMKTTSFATNAKIVAFAFQMGVLNYHMPVRFMKPEYAAYQRCTRFAIGSMPEVRVCYLAYGFFMRRQYHRNYKMRRIMAGINTAANRTFFITFDSLDTRKEKAHLVMSSKDRKDKFTWFLFNVHLTDVTNVCFTPKPGVAPSTEMQRLKKFREFYYTESQKYISG
ncbi:hypothetical protein MRX96_045511 [Rhipicephalus microplus]